MKRPSVDALAVAATWCEENEGTGEEQDACREVARWLREQEKAQAKADFVRAAGSVGAPRGVALRKWKELNHGR